MTVAFDAATVTGNLAGLTTKTFSHTCSGANRFLLAGLAGYDEGSNITGVTITYNGVAVPKLGGQSITDNNQTVLYGLKNPASGANNVVISSIPAGFSQLGGGVISLTGVHQTVANGTVVNGSGLSVNIPGVITGDLVADMFYDGNGLNANPTSPGIKRISQLTSGIYAIMSTRGGSGTVNTGYTGPSDRAISGIRIIQSEAGGAFAGTIMASGELASGVVSVTQHVSGSPDAQRGKIVGRVNNPHFLGAIASQGAVITGDGLRVTLHFDGAVAAQAPLIEALIKSYIAASGVVVSEASVLHGFMGATFTGSLLSELGVIRGSITLERLRPPDNTDIRYGRIGYRRRFEIWIDRRR